MNCKSTCRGPKTVILEKGQEKVLFHQLNSQFLDVEIRVGGDLADISWNYIDNNSIGVNALCDVTVSIRICKLNHKEKDSCGCGGCCGDYKGCGGCH